MTKVISVTALLLFFAFVTANVPCAEASDRKQVLKQLAELERTYPARTEAEKFYLLFHVTPYMRYTFHDKNGRTKDNECNRILFISRFSKDPGVAYQYSVSDTGRVQSQLDLYKWSVRDVHVADLKKEQLKTLQASIPRLPKSTTRPPLDRTMYVSFHENKDWRTQVYDSTKLPEEVKSVMAIINQRLETGNRDKLQVK